MPSNMTVFIYVDTVDAGIQGIGSLVVSIYMHVCLANAAKRFLFIYFLL